MNTSPADHIETEFQDLSKHYAILTQKYNLLEENLKNIENKMLKNKDSNTSLNDNDNISNKKFLCEIQNNQDLTDFYNAFLRELESLYIGARVLQSGRFPYSSDDSLSKAADYTKTIFEKIPIIGEIIYLVFSEFAGLFETYKSIENKAEIINVGEVASDLQTFDEFSQAIAINIIKNKEKNIIDLKGTKIETHTFKNVCKTAVEKGVGGVMELFMREEDSQAEILGKTEALNVAAYLGKGYIKLTPNENFHKFVGWVVEKKAPEKIEGKEKNNKNGILDENPKGIKNQKIENEGGCCSCSLI